MSTLRPSGIVVLACLCLGCASSDIAGSTQDLPYAAAARQCGPADGPAVSIYLSQEPLGSLEPTTAHVRIDVWQPLERLTDETWALSGSERDGGAAYYAADANPEVATSGQVRVRSIAPDGTLEGTTDLTFPTLGRIHGEFDAEWIPRAVMCG